MLQFIPFVPWSSDLFHIMPSSFVYAVIAIIFHIFFLLPSSSAFHLPYHHPQLFARSEALDVFNIYTSFSSIRIIISPTKSLSSWSPSPSFEDERPSQIYLQIWHSHHFLFLWFLFRRPICGGYGASLWIYICTYIHIFCDPGFQIKRIKLMLYRQIFRWVWSVNLVSVRAKLEVEFMPENQSNLTDSLIQIFLYVLYIIIRHHDYP